MATKAEIEAKRQEREAALDERLFGLAEWFMDEINHIRKGRKAPALMLVYQGEAVVGVRWALLDLTPTTPDPAPTK